MRFSDFLFSFFGEWMFPHYCVAVFLSLAFLSCVLRHIDGTDAEVEEDDRE